MGIPHTRLTDRAYLVAWVVLLALTASSFITTLFELGVAAEAGIALTIATVKATWVALVFMHLLEARFANRLTLGTAIAFVAILCGLMVADVATRHTFPAKPLPRAESQGR